MAKITLNDLQNPSQEESTAERGEFRAETLRCLITTPSGDVVADVNMAARAYKPAEKTGKGGIGWYADLKARDDENPNGGEYRGIAVSGGLRLSVKGLKISAGDVVDLMPEE